MSRAIRARNCSRDSVEKGHFSVFQDVNMGMMDVFRLADIQCKGGKMGKGKKAIGSQKHEVTKLS
jgi:hypothetical protein